MKKSILLILGLLTTILIGARLYLPTFLTRYVTQVVQGIPGYTGGVENIDVHLVRGAYSIHGLHIDKEERGVVQHFFESKRTDVSIQWKALFDGAIVGEIAFDQPKLNIVAKQEKESDTPSMTPDWTKPIKELIPLQINQLRVHQGQIHYLDHYSSPKVDIYLNQLDLHASNLSNATDQANKLPAHVTAQATSIGGGRLDMSMDINVLKEVPDFDMDLIFEEISMPALNDFIKAYSKIDVEEGLFSLYMEVSALDGTLNGYLKPVIEDLKIVKWKADKDEPLKLIWELIASGIVEIFENQPNNRTATKIPITGKLNKAKAKYWLAMVNVLKNAFIEAIEKKTDQSIKIKTQPNKKVRLSSS
ncbi:DUF748 domain-containing protein [Reichenbachiella carrageenanivorans]|uniref:DUF748 domain-containing protein n=1 Tax=Reichenbachiella carrageenanivorans TaxID=2979869 RepID=A0ABY6D8T9_9BACT|nr:DUF748 domain-containing protein [Reichenbachiella carrageenanivorans]UXX80300.1 DUF748 domain-containing protein [Reichenbachiella carrageenanivorans]